MNLKRKVMIVLLSLLSLVLVTAVAYAITIDIDGTREAAWDGGDSIGDLNETDITNDGVDVQTVEWTNDTSNFYFLIETHANTTWDLTGFTDAELILCLNNDNSLVTGSSLPDQCIGSGYDRYIQVVGPTPTVNVFDGAFNPIAATTDIAFSGAITEISVDVTSLGLSSANCGTMLMGVYFDGQTQDPDDNVLDDSDFTITCGSPTAVTLQSFSAQGSLLPTMTWIVAISVLLGSLMIGVLVRLRRQK